MYSVLGKSGSGMIAFTGAVGKFPLTSVQLVPASVVMNTRGPLNPEHVK
jgi:aconitase B